MANRLVLTEVAAAGTLWRADRPPVPPYTPEAVAPAVRWRSIGSDHAGTVLALAYDGSPFEGYLARSTDDGDTWAVTQPAGAGLGVWLRADVVYEPTLDVWTATTSGQITELMAYSTDGGVTWTFDATGSVGACPLWVEEWDRWAAFSGVLGLGPQGTGLPAGGWVQGSAGGPTTTLHNPHPSIGPAHRIMATDGSSVVVAGGRSASGLPTAPWRNFGVDPDNFWTPWAQGNMQGGLELSTWCVQWTGGLWFAAGLSHHDLPDADRFAWAWSSDGVTWDGVEDTTGAGDWWCGLDCAWDGRYAWVAAAPTAVDLAQAAVARIDPVDNSITWYVDGAVPSGFLAMTLTDPDPTELWAAGGGVAGAVGDGAASVSGIGVATAGPRSAQVGWQIGSIPIV